MQVPTSLKFNIEDYRMLNSMLINANIGSMPRLKVRIYVSDACYRGPKSAGEVFWHFHKQRKNNTTREAYNIMFKTPLKEIPLYINHPFLSIIAIWRLKINK